MIYFTSDLHLAHAGILKHQPARAAAFGQDIVAMDAAIIDGLNAAVKSTDELWVLGDFAWAASKYGHYRQRLKVRRLHIVRGNHDSSSLRRHVSSMAELVYRRFNGRYFHLCHYPMASWRGHEYGVIHLYGHSHGSMESCLNAVWPSRYAQDVGIDYAYALYKEWGRPFSLDELLARFPAFEGSYE